MRKLNKKILFAAWAAGNKNYFSYRTWYAPLTKVFREVVVFDPQEILYRYGKEEMNKRLLQSVEKEKPDYIYLWLIYDEIYPETLLKIKEISQKTRTVNFFGDDDTMFEKYSRYYSLFIDYPLASHQKYFHLYKKEGVKDVFFSNGVNTDIYKPINIKKKYDVTFIGVPKEDRYKFAKHLLENGISLVIAGSGWDKYPDLKKYNCLLGSIEDTASFINESRININFTKNYEGQPSYKARVFEIAACKSFVLSEYFSGYLEFLKEGKEIVLFKDEKELLEKVRYYLKNEKERESIAEKGYKKVLSTYAQDVEFRRIFSEIAKLRGKRKELPALKESTITLSNDDLNLPIPNLKDKVQKYDYVAFLEKNARENSLRNYLQVYGLIKTGKDISCCDYHVYTKALGNYLSFSAEHAYKTLPNEEFSSLLDISQFLVRKDFFLSHISEFKDFWNNKDKIINRSNATFVSLPLVHISGPKRITYNQLDKVFFPQFGQTILSLRNQKKLALHWYPYTLVLTGLLKGYPIISFIKKQYVPKILASSKKG